MGEPTTDPLRCRVAAILSRAWYRTVDDEGRRVKEIDERKAADALATLLGPLALACRRSLALLADDAAQVDGRLVIDVDAANEAIGMLDAALAAIDGAGEAEGQ